MKKFFAFSLLTVALLAVLFNLSSFKHTESANDIGSYILIDVYEVPGYQDPGLHIHYADNTSEYVPFKKMDAHNHDDNGQIIVNKVNDLVGKGYTVEHIAAGLGDKTGMITKIFLRKDK
ncbi:MAG: hypothetical protein JWO58_1860 [Chitinophagaceae bacterium]|nr:hypothetical protein [Chitinophagaceae bacterium]